MSSINVLQSKRVSYEETILAEILFPFEDISKQAIEELTNDLYYIQGIGLSRSQQLISHQLLCIELQGELVPTQFLFSFIKKHSNKQLVLKSKKWVNEWLYSKDIPLEFAVEKKDIEKYSYYLVLYYDQVVGIGQVDENKRFLKNWNNISTYLFE